MLLGALQGVPPLGWVAQDAKLYRRLKRREGPSFPKLAVAYGTCLQRIKGVAESFSEPRKNFPGEGCSADLAFQSER